MGTDHCVTPTATDVDILHQQFLIGLLIPSAVWNQNLKRFLLNFEIDIHNRD